MIILVIGIVAVALFVLGVFFALNGYQALPDAQSVVPRSDLENLKKNLAQAQESEGKLKAGLNAAQLELSAVRESLELTRGSDETIRKELTRIREESESSKQAMEAQIVEMQTAADTLKSENEHLKTTQGKGDVDQKLKSENEALKVKALEQAKGALEMIEHLKSRVKTFADNEEKNNTRVKQLEDELKKASEQVLQLQEHRDSALSVSDELQKTRQTAESLKSENISLKDKIEGQVNEIKKLKEDLGILKSASEGRISAMLKTVDELKSDNQVRRLRKDQVAEVKKSEGPSAPSAQNDHLASEKLAKSRIQLEALEKICADLKMKCESADSLQGELAAAKDKIAALEKENSLLKGPA